MLVSQLKLSVHLQVQGLNYSTSLTSWPLCFTASCYPSQTHTQLAIHICNEFCSNNALVFLLTVFSHWTIPDCYSTSKPWDYTFHHITAATTTAIMVISFSGVRGDRCNRVSYPTRNMCVLRGTSVDISCTYNSDSYTNYKYWFKWRDNQQPRDLQPEYGGRVEYPAERTGHSTLRITDLRDTDSAEYRFTFRSTSHEWKGTFHGTTLTVTGTTDC